MKIVKTNTYRSNSKKIHITIYHKENDPRYYHREDGPAIISYYSALHRKIYQKTYYINNVRHRDNGPAYIQYDCNGDVLLETYYINGKRHRNIEDGPAVINYNTVNPCTFEKQISKKWFINDTDITEFIKSNPEILTDKHLRKILL